MEDDIYQCRRSGLKKQIHPHLFGSLENNQTQQCRWYYKKQTATYAASQNRQIKREVL